MKNRFLKNQQGFSLIEAMIAMVILSVGLLAVGLMQISAIKGNTNALSRTDGVAMAQSVMDRLRGLPIDDALLSDVDPASTNLDDGRAAGGAPDDTLAGHSEGLVTGPNGQNYTVFWNVDEDTPVANAKTVRVFVYWTDQKFGLNRTIMTSVIGGLYL